MYLWGFFNVYVHKHHVIRVGLAATISQKQNPKKRNSHNPNSKLYVYGQNCNNIEWSGG